MANEASNNVSAYDVETDGVLTPAAGSPFGGATLPSGVAVDSVGNFAYVGNYGSDNVSAYTITASGALRKVKGSPFATGTYPAGMSVCRVVAGKCIPPPL